MSRSKLAAAVLLLAACTVPVVTFAQAPKSKDVMQPIDTSAGTIADGRNLLRVNLDTPLSVQVVDQPALVVYNRLHALLGIDFGYVKGVNPDTLVTVNITGTAREVFNALGNAAGVRFEATGPLNMRVLAARPAQIRKAPKEAPPVKKN